jgi:hypothetical protein
VRRAVRRVALGLSLSALLAGVAGCGDDPTGEMAYETKVAVYVGIPTRGPWGPQGLALTHGVELALADSGGGAGPFSVRLSERDVTDPDGTSISATGASVEAGNFLRDNGTVGVISGLTPVTVRTFALTANQVGAAFVSASGDQVDASPADLVPRGQRNAVGMAPTDRAIVAGLAARAKAASCRRTVLVDTPVDGVSAPHDATGLRPRTTLRAASYADPRLETGLEGALEDGADCLAVTGEPSAGNPATLLRAVLPRLRGVTILVSRGAASQGVAVLARENGLRAEAVVDDAVPGDTAVGRRIDAAHRKVFGTPATVGTIAGWRAMKLMLRAIGNAGPDGNRRDAVGRELATAAIPGPPAEGRQDANGEISNPVVSLARPESYGWRAVRALDAG